MQIVYVTLQLCYVISNFDRTPYFCVISISAMLVPLLRPFGRSFIKEQKEWVPGLNLEEPQTRIALMMIYCPGLCYYTIAIFMFTDTMIVLNLVRHLILTRPVILLHFGLHLLSHQRGDSIAIFTDTKLSGNVMLSIPSLNYTLF